MAQAWALTPQPVQRPMQPLALRPMQQQVQRLMQQRLTQPLALRPMQQPPTLLLQMPRPPLHNPPPTPGAQPKV
jgi:hypothetical protein